MLQISSASTSLLISNAPTSKLPPPLGVHPTCTAKYGGGQMVKLQGGVEPSIHRSALLRLLSAAAVGVVVVPAGKALAGGEDDEYVKETAEVINKVRTIIQMDKSDPNVASAVAKLRDASNTWVAKYRREKALLGRSSFRDMYSALNAVSGHYISFGPTAPIPAKRKARILEEVDTAEKALLRGR